MKGGPMRKLVLKMSMSLDGYVAGERPDSDWMLRTGTPDSAAWVLETLSGAGIHALGRRTFESWIGFWPTSDSPMAAALNNTPKLVFTRQASYDPGALSRDGSSSSDPASWAMTRVAAGDLDTEIDQLKREPGDYILAQGGVAFCRSLVASRLVDEYRFVVLPVALGSGTGLFTGLQDELDLQLISSTEFQGGVVGNTYRPLTAR